MNLLEAALQSVERGFHVLPVHFPDPAAPRGVNAAGEPTGGCSCWRADCEDTGKHPIGELVPHGSKDATTNADTIRRWWKRQPHANVGIATGNGLTVIDVDPRHGGHTSLGVLEAQHGELSTLSVRTGSGGWHFYFAGSASCAKDVRPGIDVRGDGGLVVAPPSLHESGKRYEWIPEQPEQPQPIPGWLRPILQKQSTNGANGSRGPASAVEDVIPDGKNGGRGRKYTLCSIAASMRRRGMVAEEILPALRAINNRRCQPPLPEQDLKRIATWTGKKPAAEKLGSESGDAGIRLTDFYAYMPQATYLFAPNGEMWPASSVNKRIPPVATGRKKKDGDDEYESAAAWLDRNHAVEQMTWCPGEPMLIPGRLISHGGWIAHNGCTTFNLYRPPTLPHGDARKAEPWLDHVRCVYPDAAEHIIRWLAHRVQRPGEKINHALVLGGLQGIGKDTALEPVKQAVGPWNFVEVSPAHLLGRFNGFVKSVILRVSEARDLGDVDRYSFYDHMKAYTAAPPDVLRVDEKNIREYSVFNVCGVVITTNHKTDGIYLPADDRRHFVAWSELSKDDFDDQYWNRLYGWYTDGGHQHVAAYLAELDIAGFDPKAPPPKTAAFYDVVDANRAPEDAELADALDRLANPDAVTLTEIATKATTTFAEWLRDRRNSRQIPYRLEAVDYVSVRNEDAKDGLWKVGDRRQVIYARRENSVRDRIAAAHALVEASR